MRTKFFPETFRAILALAAAVIALLTALVTWHGSLLKHASEATRNLACLAPGVYEGTISDQPGVPPYRVRFKVAEDVDGVLKGQGDTERSGYFDLNGRCAAGLVTLEYKFVDRPGAGTAYLKVRGGQLMGGFSGVGSMSGEPTFGKIEVTRS